MKTLKLQADVVQEAAANASVSPGDREWLVQQLKLDESGKYVAAPLVSWPTPLLRAIIDDGRISVNQRAGISLRLHGMKEAVPNPKGQTHKQLWDSEVSTPVEMAALLTELGNENNCEIKLLGRWYVASMNLSLFGKEKTLSISILFRFGNTSIKNMYYISRETFRGTSGSREPKKVRTLMERMGIRQVQTDPMEHNLLLVNAERLYGDSGKQMKVTNSVLYVSKSNWGARLEPMALGSRDWPRQAVVEPNLEIEEAGHHRYGDSAETDSKLPFVRLFSLDNKVYIYADVRDIAEYEYDEKAVERLALPKKLLTVLQQVFQAPPELLMSDIVKGKHGGLVVLASGKTGVGKTLTAEVYAEFTRSPLYKLGLAELGTTVEKVEKNLQTIFERVAHWNAVLLFDEVDVFLRERKEDLERSAIVGTFLRLMDYYRGVMFMTTNLPQVLDEAIKGRITLKIEYPNLDKLARAKVWRDLFFQAAIQYGGDADLLAEKDYNGRQIRNFVRLAKIMYPNGKLSEGNLMGVLDFGFDKTPQAVA